MRNQFIVMKKPVKKITIKYSNVKSEPDSKLILGILQMIETEVMIV